MQTDFGGNNQSQRPIVIPELDELQFKAIGEGLGFHQQEEKPRWKNPATRQSATNSIATKPTSSARTNTTNVGLSREQLGAIYQTAQSAPAPKVNSSATKTKVAIKTAGLPERFTAQLADTVIVTAAVALMLTAMLWLAGVPLAQVKTLVTSLDVAPVIAILWLFAYIAYFTILETRQTPGKILMRLKVTDMQGEGLSLSRSLERTVFRTLSWLALGFPLLMNFHGRLSRTQVIRA